MQKLLKELMKVSYMAGHLAGSGFLGSPLHTQHQNRAGELCAQILRLLTQRAPDAPKSAPKKVSSKSKKVAKPARG